MGVGGLAAGPRVSPPVSSGLARGAERCAAAVVKRTFYVLSFDLLVRDLTTGAPSSTLHHRDLEIRLMASGEPPWWEDVFSGRRRAQVRTVLADGDIGCAALLDGRVVGEAWSTRITKGDVRVRLAPDEAYTYGLMTDERYRNMGTAIALKAGLLQALAARGVTRVYTYVDRRNGPSQALSRRLLGFEQVQQARRVRAFRRWGFVVPGSADPTDGPLITDGPAAWLWRRLATGSAAARARESLHR